MVPGAALSPLKLTLDTSIVVAAKKGEPEAPDVDKLAEFARAGHIELHLAQAFENDQELAKAPQHARTLAWLAQQPVLPERLTGMFILGTSKLGQEGDGLGPVGADKIGEKITGIVYPDLQAVAERNVPRRLKDVRHLVSHYYSGNDALVTKDSDMLKPAGRLKAEVEITVWTVAEAVVEASAWIP